ncbi:MAG: glutamine synthetase family protein [Patescibacteria group bacterium]
MDNSAFTDRDVQSVIEQLFGQDIRYIRLWFPDPLGRIKGSNISRDTIWNVFQDGSGFDGSSIEGLLRIQESDLVARPIPRTFRKLPYLVDGQAIGNMLCQIYTPDGRRFAGDPLWVLEKQVAAAACLGYSTVNVGPELEFFLFKNGSPQTGKPVLVHRGGYFDEGVAHLGATVRMRAVEAFRQLGISIEVDHGEVADSQNEIDLHYQDALSMAHNAMLYRTVVKEVAAQLGVSASFMPKPLAGVNGSGMHIHTSLFTDGHNTFFDEQDTEYHLSATARQFMAGVFKYLPAGMIILCQWVNSFKRLVPGYEAPVYLCWGRRNRSALIRVPQYQMGKERATRIEVRCPDPACNIPLAFAVIIGMGLQGIREDLKSLPNPVEDDVFRLSKTQLKKRGIASLPGSFNEALAEFRDSGLMRTILGDHLHGKICDSKEAEWRDYVAGVGKKNAPIRTKVFPWEVTYYSRWV